jgi:hypothetical protein
LRELSRRGAPRKFARVTLDAKEGSRSRHEGRPTIPLAPGPRQR